MIMWNLSLGCKNGSTCKISNVICHINKIKYYNHIINSIDTGKVFDKIQHPFMIKLLNKLGIDKRFPKIIKAICDRSTGIILHDESFKYFPLSLGT